MWLVYVCDRVNDRIQVFRTDGSFVREVFVAPQTLGDGVDVGYRILPRPRTSASCTSLTART